MSAWFDEMRALRRDLARWDRAEGLAWDSLRVLGHPDPAARAERIRRLCVYVASHRGFKGRHESIDLFEQVVERLAARRGLR